jgi:hypothetical protein
MMNFENKFYDKFGNDKFKFIESFRDNDKKKTLLKSISYQILIGLMMCGLQTEETKLLLMFW